MDINSPSGEISSTINIAVTAGGFLVAMLGVLLLAKGITLLSAERAKDSQYIDEFASKKRHHFFFVVMGAALITSGLMVALVPF